MKKKTNPWIEPENESSNIKGLRPNGDGTFDVMFKSGAQYRYRHVKGEDLIVVMDQIRTAESAGKKFNELVKNNKDIKFELLG